MKNRSLKFLMVMCAVTLSHTASADILCVQQSAKADKKSLAVSLSKAIIEVKSDKNCPKGFVPLIGTTEFWRNDACKTETVTANTPCAEGTACEIHVYCGESGRNAGGSRLGDQLQTWSFDSGTGKNGLLVSADFYTHQFGYATGVSITTRSIPGTGSHTASLRVICCNAI